MARERRSYRPSAGAPGQRIDGVYLTDTDLPVFRHVVSPGTAELQALVPNIAERIGRPLEKRGLIERDCENAWLSGDMAPAGSLDDGLTVHVSAPIRVLVNLRLSFARSHVRRKSWIGWTFGRF
jgi:hypothetical protein